MTDLRQIASTCIAALREAGADMAQCEVSLSEKREFNVDGGAFSLFRTTFNTNISMTAYREKKRGTVTLNRFSEDAIRRSAAECLALACSGSPDDAWEIAPHIGEKSFEVGSPEPDTDALFFRTKELMETVSAEYPLILMEQMIVDHTKWSTVYADTSDNLYTELGGAYNVNLMFSAHEGERSSSFAGADFSTASLDTPFIDCGAVRVTLRDTERQLDTVPVSGKFVGTVVLTPDCLGSMLSTIIDNFASGSNLISGTSVWLGKVGSPVASPDLTLSLAPKADSILYREEYTNDGYLTEDFNLIENGKLTGFVASAYVANKAGVTRSPNTSGAYVMPAGEKTLDELIAGIEHGLLVARFSGGEPGVGGDFSGVAKNSFLIENGRITSAVSETMISGNLADMLMHFEGASSERIASGRSLLPYAAFSGITVSGK